MQNRTALNKTSFLGTDYIYIYFSAEKKAVTVFMRFARIRNAFHIHLDAILNLLCPVTPYCIPLVQSTVGGPSVWAKHVAVWDGK